MISRRQFLAGALFCAASPITALTTFADAASDEPESENGAPLPIEVAPAQAPVQGQFAVGLLRLKSAIHGEAYEFYYRDTNGTYDQRMLAQLNWFLRCRDRSWQCMDLRVIEALNYTSKLFGDPIIQINSGYRSPAYNAKLASKNENVARNSLHIQGRAIDFCIPGISILNVCSRAVYTRSLIGYGGVGYYPRSGFVHLDSGPFRSWVK